MPKMKTKQTFKKRIKVTGTGKFMKRSNYTSHFATNKTHKQNKNLHKPSITSNSTVKRVRDLLQG